MDPTAVHLTPGRIYIMKKGVDKKDVMLTVSTGGVFEMVRVPLHGGVVSFNVTHHDIYKF